MLPRPLTPLRSARPVDSPATAAVTISKTAWHRAWARAAAWCARRSPANFWTAPLPCAHPAHSQTPAANRIARAARLPPLPAPSIAHKADPVDAPARTTAARVLPLHHPVPSPLQKPDRLQRSPTRAKPCLAPAPASARPSAPNAPKAATPVSAPAPRRCECPKAPASPQFLPAAKGR